MPDRIRLVVLFGGQSAEHEVSCVTASHVLAAADPNRYDVQPVGITREGQWVFAEDAAKALADGSRALPAALDAAGPDVDALPVVAAAEGETVVVLPLLHGPMGEDGTVQGLLELANVPYVGAGVLGSALAMDKAKAKEVIAHAGIPQAPYLAWHESQLSDEALARAVADLGLPVFVKPSNMGSSIGVSKATSLADLAAAVELALTYDEWVVIEQAVSPAREIEVAVLGNLEPKASVPGEIVPGAEFYDYADKYLSDAAKLIAPAELPDGVEDRIRRIAVEAFAAIGGAGMARVDFLLDGESAYVNEINTVPGFTRISMYPRLWAISGVPLPELVTRLVDIALERHRERQGLDAGIKGFLAELRGRA